MAATTITRSRLRRLAELRPHDGRVLSVFIDLDPAEFATPSARATQISSVLNEAEKRIDAMTDLDHDELVALRADVERVRTVLQPANLGAGGVRGLALYACGPADVLEILRLPYPVESRVVIDRVAHIEPLALAGERERWCVVLANRRNGRIMLGSEDGFEEIGRIVDDVHGQHDQGGWSQARYQRSIEKEKLDHLDRLAHALLDLLRQRPFDRLLIAAPDPLDDELERRLHPYVAERLAGRLSIDVDTSTPAEVHAAAAPVFEEHRRERERAALERLRSGFGKPDGRVAAGLPDVLAALNEQRVETLLLEPRASHPGWVDPVTGYLAAEPGQSPTSGPLQARDDVLEAAVERAIEQSAEVLVVRHFPDLGAHGGVAALLRF